MLESEARGRPQVTTASRATRELGHAKRGNMVVADRLEVRFMLPLRANFGFEGYEILRSILARWPGQRASQQRKRDPAEQP
jgi:hypothetical protein